MGQLNGSGEEGSTMNVISKVLTVLQHMPKHKPGISFLQVTLKYILLLSNGSMDLYLSTITTKFGDTAIHTHTPDQQ